jgi:hypothetical protein
MSYVLQLTYDKPQARTAPLYTVRNVVVGNGNGTGAVADAGTGNVVLVLVLVMYYCTERLVLWPW